MAQQIQTQSDALDSIRSVIEKFLNPEKTFETCLLHIGNVIVFYLSKLSSDSVSDFVAMTPFLISRLVHCTSPNILESLLYPFIYMVQAHTEVVLENISDKHLQIFVDKLIDYVEYGKFKNSKVKNACLELLLTTICNKLRYGGSDIVESDKNKNICFRLPQIREYSSIFAFTLLLCKIVDRQQVSYEMNGFESYFDCDSNTQQEAAIEGNCIATLKELIQSHPEIHKSMQECVESYSKAPEVALVNKYLL